MRWGLPLLVALLATRRVDAATSVTTQRVDNARTGAVLTETVLTRAAVRERLARAYERRVDGQIQANPLFVAGVALPTGEHKDLFLVATANNCVYAFDLDDHRADEAPAHPADHCDTTTSAVWHRAVGPSADLDVCAQTTPPRVGVTSTPVIDLAANALYLVSLHADDRQHYIHELDLATGADRRAPVCIAGTDQGKTFDAACQRNRPGLLLQDGVVYAAFASLSCDRNCAKQPFRGWVFAYRAADLSLADVLTTAPDGGATGIWQSGNGLAGDGAAVYFMTGNDRSKTKLGDSFVRVELEAGALAVTGHYKVPNSDRLRAADTDLGSGGPLLLPGGKLLGGGKDGALYLVDADMPGKADQAWQAFHNTWHGDPKKKTCTLRHIDRKLPENGCYMPPERYADSEHWGPNIHGGAVYWKSAASSFGYVYMQPEKEYPRLFRYDLATSRMETAPYRTGAERAPDGMPGAAISISADGDREGIVWVLLENSDAQAVVAPGHLVAYDADTLGELWRDDDPVAFAKFTPPLAVAGHVIRPTAANRVIVYALAATAKAKSAAGPLPCYSIGEKYRALGGAAGVLGVPTSPVLAVGDAAGGRVQLFAGQVSLGASCDAPEKESKVDVPAAIYWSPATCAHALLGEALERWLAAGAESGPLGYPTSDEVPTLDGAGRRISFERGAIRWTVARGYEVVAGGTP